MVWSPDKKLSRTSEEGTKLVSLYQGDLPPALSNNTASDFHVLQSGAGCLVRHYIVCSAAKELKRHLTAIFIT